MVAMTARGLKAACLAMPGAEEEFPFPGNPDLSVFKVAGKIFALSVLEAEPLKVSLKCDPEIAEQLRTRYPAIVPGYHLNKRHWNTVTVDASLSVRRVREMIEDSYDLVVASLPRAVRLTFDRS
ncbi:putative DNA-binding protein (MmcQ/YjbR family) [Streptomyces sp. SPB162]|nr:putative DNA-binding protein (MmcQ/YjbR family) [Streptomyces sp. SPB162]